MKVLQINSVCGIGSTGRIATDIHNILIEEGHESHIAFGRGVSNNTNNIIKIGKNIDNYMHVAKTRVFDKHGFGSQKATVDFIKRVKELKPDIIHLHNIHGYYINVEILFNYIKAANIPVVWTLHDCWSFTGHCAYFDFVGCEKWVDGCHKCPDKKAYPSSFFIDNSQNNYLRKKRIFSNVNNLSIVTPSNWLSNLVSKSPILNYYPVEVINNGIDLNVFKPTQSSLRTKYNLTNKFIVLGVASVWDRRKGLEDFVKLSNKLSENFTIVLIGLSSKQIKELPENIIGIKKTNSTAELAEWYSLADIYFNPTYEDNYPTTNLEALACGTKVITYYTGGSHEVIDENCGHVINKGDLSSVEEIVTNYQINNVGNKLVNHSVLDRSEVAKKYIELYERVI